MLFLNIITIFSLYVTRILSSRSSTRIVKGTDAYFGQFPFIVSIRYIGTENKHFCAGTILSETWILTAAHCFINLKAKYINVQYGVTQITTDNYNTVNVKKMHSHEGFVESDNDIAVVELEKSIPFGPLVQPVKFYNSKVKDGAFAILIGWGLNATHGVVQKHLQLVRITIVDNKKCNETFRGVIQRTNICSGSRRSVKGQCSGDSGGPLLVRHKQVGIVSWSIKPCGNPFYPAVFTKVSEYFDWIQNKTGINLNKQNL